MTLDDAIAVMNEARELISPGSETYTVERILTSAATEVRLSAMYIASQIERHGATDRRASSIASLQRAVVALKHFAIDGDEPCDFLTVGLLSGTPAGLALCWFVHDREMQPTCHALKG